MLEFFRGCAKVSSMYCPHGKIAREKGVPRRYHLALRDCAIWASRDLGCSVINI